MPPETDQTSPRSLNGGAIGPQCAASKAALRGLMRNLATPLAGAGVTVNSIVPALIGGTRMLLPSDPADPGALPLPIPVGRLGTTEEVAGLATAILRDGYLTNRVITLDGGLLPT
jgi:3-oxoacyl-[acyl-carrier protein] reductase